MLTDYSLESLLKKALSTEQVRAFPLDTSDAKRPLWVGHTYGSNTQLPLKSHVVAIFTQTDGTWQELDRLSLGDEPWTLVEASQISMGPDKLWIFVGGGWGVYSDCRILIRFDGQKLHKEESYCNRNNAGTFEDLNGDGIVEIVEDWTNHSVYCGACGVSFVEFRVLRWNGHQFVEEGLKRLDASAPSRLQQLNNQAVTLAQAELWKDAQATIEEALTIDNRQATVTWNAAWINLHATAKKEEADFHSLLLPLLFYGDYDTILNKMRIYSLQDLFEHPTELTTITGLDDDWQKKATIDWVIHITDSTVKYEPKFAPGHFLRGWAMYLRNPHDPSAFLTRYLC